MRPQSIDELPTPNIDEQIHDSIRSDPISCDLTLDTDWISAKVRQYRMTGDNDVIDDKAAQERLF